MRWYSGDIVCGCLGWETPPLEKHKHQCLRNTADTSEIPYVYAVARFGGGKLPHGASQQNTPTFSQGSCRCIWCGKRPVLARET